MNCPKCKKEMMEKSKDISNNTKNLKKYDRTLYHCEIDDIWISIEIPEN